jgi:hypothetical protein
MGQDKVISRKANKNMTELSYSSTEHINSAVGIMKGRQI